MQFKDVAYVILTESGEPLHYRLSTTRRLPRFMLLKIRRCYTQP